MEKKKKVTIEWDKDSIKTQILYASDIKDWSALPEGTIVIDEAKQV